MSYGYWSAYPDTAKAGWGARAILCDGAIDIPFDRQSARGEKPQIRKLQNLLNTGILAEVRNKIRELSYSYELRSSEEKEHILYDSDDVLVIANTNASYGYLYMLAYLK